MVQSKVQSACSDFLAQSRQSPTFVLAVDGAENGLDCKGVVFVQVDDALASLGELAGRQEFLDDFRLRVVNQILAGNVEVNDSFDLVMAIFTSLQRFGVFSDTKSQVMTLGDSDDFGGDNVGGCSDVGLHSAFGLLVSGGRGGGRRKRRHALTSVTSSVE